MFKLISSRIKSNFLHYFLVFIAYVTVLLVISFGVYFVNLSKNMTLDWTNGEINHQKLISVNISNSNSIDYDKLVNVLKKYSKTIAIRINGLTETIPSNGAEWQVQLQPVLFTQNPEWIPKINKGRYIKPDESCSKSKIAVIGAGVVANKLTNKLDNTIVIGGEKFNVIGVVGKLTENYTNYLGSVFIPLESLPDKNKKEIKTIEIYLLKNNGNPKNEMKALLVDLNKLSNVNVSEVDMNGQLSDFYNKLSITIFAGCLIILISVGNISILIFYLMLKTKKCILISIALGATKKLIWKQIFIELILISVCSIISASIFTNLLTPFIKQNFTMILNIKELQFSSFNIIVPSLATIVMSFLISIMSVRKFFRLNLITELKGE
ncbi:ABC transporter permease [Clostridium tagluense]|uniref:Uncharacterized protein n=1 Tax=Clostridium tagluense TaxID=360422 RepID=A0A401ULS3_9CLOT|nr:ABC transporter permease [Clostridium tagluense]GCD10478.1 hypothetical protein Ctaglu_21010 [Clostridium tagluense]